MGNWKCKKTSFFFKLLFSLSFKQGHENQAVLNQSQVILTQSIASASEHLDLLSLSGAVGTALYVAPELLDPSATNKYSYTKKVDIYSLGIMFYEMCFPFETEMERVSVLKNLRNTSINFPPEIDLEHYSNQYLLIKAMLDHDPSGFHVKRFEKIN